MEWQTLINVAQATYPSTVQTLEKAASLGARLTQNGMLGWKINWDTPPQGSTPVLEFKGQEMMPKLKYIQTLLEGLPCYVAEPEILWDTPEALQREMTQIHGLIQQAANNNDTNAAESLLKRLKAVRLLWNNTRVRWNSSDIWALIFDEVARREPALCPYVVALSAYRVSIENNQISPTVIPPELYQKHNEAMNFLIQGLNNGLIALAATRFQMNNNENQKLVS